MERTEYCKVTNSLGVLSDLTLRHVELAVNDKQYYGFPHTIK